MTFNVPETLTDPPNTEMAPALEPEIAVPEIYKNMSFPIEDVWNAAGFIIPWFGFRVLSAEIS